MIANNFTKKNCKTYNESSSTRQLDGSAFILLAASTNLLHEKCKMLVQQKYYLPGTKQSVDNKPYYPFIMSHISGEGFPMATSSPPIITENDSFHPK